MREKGIKYTIEDESLVAELETEMLKAAKELEFEKAAIIRDEIKRIKETVIKPSKETNDYLRERGTPPISSGIYLDQLLKRAELDYQAVEILAKSPMPIPQKVACQAEIEIKYDIYQDEWHGKKAVYVSGTPVWNFGEKNMAHIFFTIIDILYKGFTEQFKEE